MLISYFSCWVGGGGGGEGGGFERDLEMDMDIEHDGTRLTGRL